MTAVSVRIQTVHMINVCNICCCKFNVPDNLHEHKKTRHEKSRGNVKPICSTNPLTPCVYVVSDHNVIVMLYHHINEHF